MSTAERRINERLEEFTRITRDINWQKESFLNYCTDITKAESPDSDKDQNADANHNVEETIVKKVLDGYFVLFLVFYERVRGDLEKHYTEALDVNEADVKLRLQEALSKLVDEWQRVYAIVTALRERQANLESRRLLNQMDPFVDIAMKDVGLSYTDFPVVLQFGQSYSLKFSKYSDKFAALSIPLWVLESPWEWTILWHELAGERVRQEKVDKPESFSSQFDEILKSLKRDNNAVDAALGNGWSVDWYEELFEDSFSVIHFPFHFLIVFQSLLERFPDGGKGLRHPPRIIRLATAMFLHLQMKMKRYSNEPLVVDEWPDWENWSELKDETDYKKFMQFDPYQLLSNALDVKVAWLTARKILEWHKDKKVYKSAENEFRNIINDAIKKYAYDGYAEGERDALLLEIRKTIASLLPAQKKVGLDTQLSKKINKEKLSDLISTPTKTKKLLDDHLQVKELLEEKDYKQLLDLTFYDEDFLASWSITNVSVNGISETWNPSGMSILPSTIRNGIAGNISYTVIINDSGSVTEKSCRTTTQNWNAFFSISSPYHI